MDPLTVILIVGCGMLLSGCGAQESNNEGIKSDGWEPQPKEDFDNTLATEDENSSVNNYAKLKCTAAKEEIVKLKSASGNMIQGGTEAIGIDVDIELFSSCKNTTDKKCFPEIEGGEWKCTDEKHMSNKCNTVNCTSFLFCLTGFGMIYVHKDGQEEGKMHVFGAFYVMELWLNEGYAGVSEERLLVAMEEARMYGGQTKIGNFTSTFKNDTLFDTSILAWTNYWNQKQKDIFGEGGFTPIRAEIIKCMMAKESSMGDGITKNATRDVMQCLYAGDPGIWAITTLDPYATDKTHPGVSEKVIWTIDLNGQLVKSSLVLGYIKEDTNIKTWLGNGTWKEYQNIIYEENNYLNKTKQEYVYHQGNVTPDMSICAGIWVYAYKLNKERGQLTEAEAVKNYNASKDEIEYVKNVEAYMKEMGDGLDGYNKVVGP